MKCHQCTFDIDKWEDITEKCYLKLRLTSTEVRLGYAELNYKPFDKEIKIDKKLKEGEFRLKKSDKVW